jgi:hypothetical protein
MKKFILIVPAAKRLELRKLRFKNRPQRKWAIQAEKIASKSNCWDPISLVGLYIKRYRERFLTEYGTVLMLENLLRDMEHLCKRLGSKDTRWAVEAVFSAKMKWVTGDHVGLILREEAYYRWVVPVAQVLRKERGGEQAEWRGSRRNEGTYKRVSL